MTIEQPHRPFHEASVFWYSTEHTALLYDVTVDEAGTRAEADHRKVPMPFPPFHDHWTPHGIEFSGSELTEVQQQANIANVELVVRLWNQAEENDPLDQPQWRKRCIFPVPKLLALFLAARRIEMHKEESVSQALLLLQVYLSSKTS